MGRSHLPVIKYILTLFIALLLTLTSLSSFASDEFQFEDESEESFERGSDEESGNGIPVRGKISMESARQTGDPSRWIRLGPAIHLISEYNSEPGLFYLEATGRYNGAYRLEDDSGYVINNYEKELVLRELYWKKSIGPVTLSAGNIITVWGRADLLPVTDLVSAVERSESFFANPEEARLGQNSLKLEYFGKNSETGLLFIPYPRFDRFTDGDHPYSYLPGYTIKEKRGKRACEGGIRQTIRFPRGALSFMGGWFNNREPLLSHSFTPEGDLQFFKEYEPGLFSGVSTNWAYDPLLIKFDFAYHHNRSRQKVQAATGLPDGISHGKELDATAGIDYNGGRVGSFILEVSASLPFGKNEELPQERKIILVSGGWSNTYFSDNLKVNAFCLIFEKPGNILFRIDGEFLVTDLLSVYLQYTGIVTGSKDIEYSRFSNYDRADLALRYNFDMN